MGSEMCIRDRFKTAPFPEGTTMALISHTEGISPRDSCRQQGKILLGPSSRAVFVMSTNQTAVGAPGAVSAAVGAGSTPVGGSTTAVTATSTRSTAGSAAERRHGRRVVWR